MIHPRCTMSKVYITEPFDGSFYMNCGPIRGYRLPLAQVLINEQRPQVANINSFVMFQKFFRRGVTDQNIKDKEIGRIQRSEWNNSSKGFQLFFEHYAKRFNENMKQCGRQKLKIKQYVYSEHKKPRRPRERKNQQVPQESALVPGDHVPRPRPRSPDSFYSPYRYSPKESLFSSRAGDLFAGSELEHLLGLLKH
jgi:hypothetical protein